MASTKKDTGLIDMTKTGPLSYRQLQQLNSYSDETPQILGGPSGTRAAAAGVGIVNYDNNPAFADFGNSRYDSDLVNYDELSQYQDLRGDRQPWYAQIGAGLAKGVILVGTTFLDGTVGLVLGIGESIRRGDLSGLWDNDFSRAMQAVNEWSEEVMPNYYSYNERNSPWYEKIFTANFLGDKFIKNLGFAVGALYSGGVTSAGLKLTKVPQLIGAITKSTKAPAAVTTLIGATTSAVNEGRIEALNNSKDWQDLKIQELDDKWRERLNNKYAPQMEALSDEYQAAMEEYEATKGQSLQRVGTGDNFQLTDPAYQRYQMKIAALDAQRNALESSMSSEWDNRDSNEDYRKIVGKIEEDRLKMGNTDMLMNLPILTASNIVQFTKFYANGFNTARRAGVRTIEGAAEGTARYAGKTFSKGEAALKVGQGALAEGTEEISQKAAGLVAGDYYSTDVNNFYKSQIDPDAEQETLSWVKSFANGINETVNDGSSWEEFFIGALTGLMGVPTFRSMRNSDGSFRSPVVLQGGAINEVREYNEQIARSQEVANYLNSRVQSPEFLNYYRGLIRHNKYQNDMNQAVEDNDEFNFKNAEHAQFVSDITMFDNAGKLGDLRAYIDLAYDTSDENLQSIVENTTSTITDENGKEKKVGPFVDSNGNPLTDTEEGKQEMIDKLTQTRDEMLSTLDNYRKTKNNLDTMTGGSLTNEQLTELTWLKTQVDDWTKRASDMTPLVKRTLEDLSSNLETSLLKSLGDASMSDDVESIESVGEVANRLGIGSKRIEQLQKLALLSDKKLAAILTSPKNEKFVEGLIADIEAFGSDIISALDKQNVVKLLSDLPKIGKGIETYNQKLEEYLANPEKLAEDQARATEEVRQDIENKKAQSVREQLTSAQSVAQVREALNQAEDRELANSVLEELASNGNQQAINYKETEQYHNELRKALSELGESSEVTEDALSLWSDHYNLAENLEQIGNPNSVAINNENAFDEAAEGDVALSEERFQNARYALQRAMSKVNNDIKFKNRFSEEYRRPVDEKVKGKGTDKDSTGDSGTSTVPHVNPDAGPIETPSAPVGNITPEMVAAENAEANRRVETQRDVDGKQKGQRKYYRPAIPELHIEASKEGDFRPFDTVVAERENGADFSGIYSYLRDNGAFDYVNVAKLKPGDTLGFMIDPDFNDHTIFLVDTRNNQIVGSIDESDTSIARYEGLEGLIKKVRDEYQASRQGTSPYDKNTGLLSEEYVNSIIRNSPEIPYDTLTWSEEQNKAVTSSGKSRIIDMGGRKVVVLDINGFHMPFYLSTGHGGKADVASGKWYPIFGIGQDNWLNKLSGTEINDYYGSPIFKQISEALDRIYGDIRDDNAIPAVKATGSHMDFINQDLNPTENGNNNTRELVEKNIEEAKSKVIEAANKLTVSTPATGKFFATPQVRVSKMMVGRIPYGTEDRSLADIPGVLDGETKPVFGIIKNGALTTNEKIDDRLIIKPVDMAQKEGRLYLLIPNAAGTYSPAAVRVKHFNNQEFNLDDATVANTPMGKSIAQAIDRLTSATSQDDVSIAMKDLAQDIYLQDVMVTWFDADAGSGIVVGKKIRKSDGTYEMTTINGQEHIKEEKTSIYFQSSRKSAELSPGIEFTAEAAKDIKADLSSYGQPRDVADIRRDILNTLLKYNLPLQVSASRINETGYNNRVIKSNILTSNLREASVISSWFTTDYFDSEGNLQQAISPASVKPAPGRKSSSPVGGNEGVVQGTRISVSGNPYIVDLKHSIIIDEKTGKKWGFSVGAVAQKYIDLAWAQENYGDSTESSGMTENKIITPKGEVLDRTTGQYIFGEEAQGVKDKIAGLNRENEARVAQSKRVIADIYENQKKVDKTRTDGENYYILEEDGQYHEYSRVHTRLGGNWTQSEKQTKALQDIRVRLSQLADNPAQFDQYLDQLQTKYKQYALDLSAFKGKVDAKTRDTIVNVIRDKMAGTNSQRALDAGTAVDSVIRNFFTSKNVPVKPDILSEGAFTDLITKLTEIKSRMKQLGETFMADNIVLFQKYPDGSRVAGEVDILSVDRNGNFRIYDVKTSRYSFGDFVNRYGHTVNYFKNKSNTQRMSTEEYYTLQLSAYQNLFESQYGMRPSRLAIMPFVLNYDRDKVSSITSERGIPITYNPAVNVPLVDRAIKPVQPEKTLPIFESSLETMNPENRVLPENAIEGAKVGFYEVEGKLYTGYLKNIGNVKVTYPSGQEQDIPIHMTKVRDKGFGREGELGGSSEYYAVFPNGYAMRIFKRGYDDAEIATKMLEALSAKPDKVRGLNTEKTQIYNPRELEESITGGSTQTSEQGGAAKTVQRETAVNKKSAKRTRHKLRAVDSTRPTWNREKELAWIERNLPQLSEQDRVRIVNGLIQVAENGPLAWGRFSDGIIELSDVAAEGTAYHEAFHAVFSLMMDRKDRLALLAEARQTFGEKSDLDLEEDLAEAFREYVASQETRSLGRRIIDFFKNLLAKVTNWKYVKPTMNNYFRMINNSRYSNTAVNGRATEVRYRLATNNSDLEKAIDTEFAKAKSTVRALNNRRYNTEEEAKRAFDNSGIHKDFFYRITRQGANNAVGYKIQLLTQDAFEKYKDTILTENELSREKKAEDRYFDSIDPEVQMNLLNKGWTKEQFDSISQEERDNAVECSTL